jgi:hypothetical protein
MTQRALILLFSFHFIIILSCVHSGQKEKLPVTADIADTLKPKKDIPATPISASAYLIYKDGSLSTFNVLNDSTKALWNTIIGAGDAEKPSEKTRLVLRGNAGLIHCRVKNGSKIIIDQKGLQLQDSLVFTLNNTGCDIITVEVKGATNAVYKGRIEFHCGE